MSISDSIVHADPRPMPRFSPRDQWATALLVAIPLAVLGRVCFARFTTWDDNVTIQFNPDFLPPTLASMRHVWTTTNGLLYTPVTQSLWWLISACTQTADAAGHFVQVPWPFHSANLAIHLLAGVTVFQILRLLRLATFASLCGAMVFAIHPVQVEAVAWTSGLKDVLAGTLSLLAVQQYLLYARGPVGETSPVHYFWTFAAFVAAMLAKPSAMSLPLCVAALDRIALHRPWRLVLWSTTPLLLASLPIAIVARLVQSAPGLPTVPLWSRPLIACDSIVFYMGKLAWPSQLAIDYGHSPFAVIARGSLCWNWLIPVSIGIALWSVRRSSPLLGLGALLFVFGCAPVLGLTTSGFSFASTTADHYIYFSMLGLSLAVATFLTTWPNVVLRWAIIAALLILGTASNLQTRYWADDAALWPHELMINPTSWVALSSFGTAYYQNGEYLHAAACFKRATRVLANYPVLEDLAREQLCRSLQQAGKLDDAVLERRELIALDDGKPYLHHAWAQHTAELGELLCVAGRYGEAIPYLQTAHAIAPNDRKVDALLQRATTQTISPAGSQQ